MQCKQGSRAHAPYRLVMSRSHFIFSAGSSDCIAIPQCGNFHECSRFMNSMIQDVHSQLEDHPIGQGLSKSHLNAGQTL